ncbi:MAG: hypothetical protein ACTSWD_05010 [Candidatus Heimdallarchaeota archaeon]
MDNKEKKKLMTRAAKGEITMTQAEKLMKPIARTRKNKISADFIGDDSKKMREGTITPLPNTKIKSGKGGKK